MRPESDARWTRIEEIFHAAMARAPGDRERFLDEQCGDEQCGDEQCGIDLGLRAEVESLLRAAASEDSLLERPAMGHLGVSTPTDRQPGSTLGPYRIVERLGAGGMGEVFRARDSRLERDVALKTLPSHLCGDRSYLERLRREARALAGIAHPNVAVLHGMEEAEGQVALVMELVEGETLSERLARSPTSIADGLRIGVQIAQGIEAAHRKGVVHRDLKPGNVMITRGGLVKVLDFGIAKRGGTEIGEDDATRTAFTARGTVLGTPGYMSPEQAEGRVADFRSDIFSFGTILYEMIAGRPAFGGATAAQRTAAVLRDEPPALDTLVPAAPRRLARLVALCLNKDKEDRYQSITDVRFALEDVLTDSGNADVTEPASLKRRALLDRRAWLGAGITAGLDGFAYLALRRDSRVPVIVTPLTMYDSYVGGSAISPDGRMVTFTWSGERQDNTDVYVQVVGSTDPLRVTQNPAPETRPIWSPDSRSVAFSRLRDSGGAGLGTEMFFTVPVLGGPERLVGRGFASDWSRDGATFLAMVAPPGGPSAWLLVAASDGSSRKLLSTPEGSTLERGRFSPDGRKVYYVEQTGPGESILKQIDIAGGAPRRVEIAGLRFIGSFAWLGASELLVYGRTSESLVPQLYRVAASGGTPRLLPFGRNGLGVDIAAGTGSIVYTLNQTSSNIWRVGAWPGSDRQPRKLIASEFASLTPTLSPTGDRIAFSSMQTGTWKIWIADAEGNGASPAVRFPAGATAMVGSPTWSPDARRIAFDAYIGTYPNVFVSAIDSGPPRQLTQGNARNIIPVWSPDGKWIYYTSGVADAQSVWRVSPEGGAPQQITQRGGYSIRISADGKYLYYLLSRREGGLWRVPAEGGKEELLVPAMKSRNFYVLTDGVYMLDPGVTELSPTARGRALFYRFQTGKVEDLGFQTERPVNHYGIGMSPDGKWLYYTQEDRSASNTMLVENFV